MVKLDVTDGTICAFLCNVFCAHESLDASGTYPSLLTIVTCHAQRWCAAIDAMSRQQACRSCKCSWCCFPFGFCIIVFWSIPFSVNIDPRVTSNAESLIDIAFLAFGCMALQTSFCRILIKLDVANGTICKVYCCTHFGYHPKAASDTESSMLLAFACHAQPRLAALAVLIWFGIIFSTCKATSCNIFWIHHAPVTSLINITFRIADVFVTDSACFQLRSCLSASALAGASHHERTSVSLAERDVYEIVDHCFWNCCLIFW